MKNIVEIINSLPGLLTLKPATLIQITEAEIQLRIKFAEEYKQYLTSFGAIIADGIELSGISKAEYRNVVSLTKKEWENNPEVPHSMYVIENTYIDGVIIWQDTNGLIYQSAPNREPKQIAISLADYIINYRQ